MRSKMHSCDKQVSELRKQLVAAQVHFFLDHCYKRLHSNRIPSEREKLKPFTFHLQLSVVVFHQHPVGKDKNMFDVSLQICGCYLGNRCMSAAELPATIIYAANTLKCRSHNILCDTKENQKDTTNLLRVFLSFSLCPLLICLYKHDIATEEKRSYEFHTL